MAEEGQDRALSRKERRKRQDHAGRHTAPPTPRQPVQKPQRPRCNKKNIASLCILICCALVFVVCGGILVQELRAYQIGKDQYNEITQAAVTEAASGSELPVTVDFEELRRTNPDVIGWIYSPDTVINYPIVQAADNEYYLTRLFNGTQNKNGCLFVDYRNNRNFWDYNTFIYGHHMRNGSMFASLVGYKDQAYYDAHPVMYLLTPQQNYRLEIFSAFVTDPLNAVYTLGFSSDEEFLSYTTTAKSHSDFTCDVPLTPYDRVVVLSTCTYEYNDARYVVLGKLVEMDE